MSAVGAGGATCDSVGSESIAADTITSNSVASPSPSPTMQPKEQDQTASTTAGGNDENECHEDSALHSNIRTKGQNSYYYAHKKREDVEVHEWDGNAEPRLLKKEPLPTEKLQQQVTVANALQQFVPITQYAWSDSKKKVSIYVTLPQVGDLQDEQVRLEWTANHFALKIEGYHDENWLLSIQLANEIADAKLKRKQDQVVVLLHKYTEFSWHSLKKE